MWDIPIPVYFPGWENLLVRRIITLFSALSLQNLQKRQPTLNQSAVYCKQAAELIVICKNKHQVVESENKCAHHKMTF